MRTNWCFNEVESFIWFNVSVSDTVSICVSLLKNNPRLCEMQINCRSTAINEEFERVRSVGRRSLTLHDANECTTLIGATLHTRAIRLRRKAREERGRNASGASRWWQRAITKRAPLALVPISLSCLVSFSPFGYVCVRLPPKVRVAPSTVPSHRPVVEAIGIHVIAPRRGST